MISISASTVIEITEWHVTCYWLNQEVAHYYLCYLLTDVLKSIYFSYAVLMTTPSKHC